MKTLLVQELCYYQNYPALLFTPLGILVEENTHSPWIVWSQLQEHFEAQQLFVDDDRLLLVQGHPKPSLNTLFRPVSAKACLRALEPPAQSRLLRAIHWMSWCQRVHYCHHCGGLLGKLLDRPEKQCAACQASFFPNLSPAVMVLVQRQEEILLARSPQFKPGLYSALAGFVDLGESAEAAAHREVFEEVGLSIQDLTYFGSQSWPFTGSFMIAFRAQYEDGLLSLDPHEIEEARWFSIHHLPAIPPSPSIANALINSVLTG